MLRVEPEVKLLRLPCECLFPVHVGLSRSDSSTSPVSPSFPLMLRVEPTYTTTSPFSTHIRS